MSLIRTAEAGPRGYNADLRNDDKWPITASTFDQVRTWGRSQVAQGEPSSAIAGYQFITTTMDWLKADLRLTGRELMTPQFQDDLAIHLINAKRTKDALKRFARNEISIAAFGDLLAKEWASMPVLYEQKGFRRTVKRGQSYYTGVAGNMALVSADKVQTLLVSLRDELKAALDKPSKPDPVVVPETPEVEPGPVDVPPSTEDDPNMPSWKTVQQVIRILGFAAAGGAFAAGWIDQNTLMQIVGGGGFAALVTWWAAFNKKITTK